MRIHTVFALACLAAGASADIKTYQNDSIGSGGTIACQAGFAANEIGAAIYTVPAGDGPIMLRQAQWWVCDGSGFGLAQARPMQVLVYSAGGPNPGAPLFNSANINATPGFLNAFDLPANLVFPAGSTFTIGIKLINGSLFQNFSTLATDADGCQGGKSLIFAVPPSAWTDACSLGVSGDMLVRIQVLTQGPVQYGAGLAGTSGVPNIGSTNPWTVGSANFGITVSSVKPGAPGVLAYAGAAASIPALGGTILINPTAITTLNAVANGSGSLTKTTPIPNAPSLIGAHVFFQGAFVDSAAAQGIALTRGLDITISTP